uniref:CST complex subunit CTC1 n=1 Tax=Mesocestoides corti TaxID=53468 RepID=A0A5K3FSN3_MESCO
MPGKKADTSICKDSLIIHLERMYLRHLQLCMLLGVSFQDENHPVTRSLFDIHSFQSSALKALRQYFEYVCARLLPTGKVEPRNSIHWHTLQSTYQPREDRFTLDVQICDCLRGTNCRSLPRSSSISRASKRCPVEFLIVPSSHHHVGILRLLQKCPLFEKRSRVRHDVRVPCAVTVHSTYALPTLSL